MRKSLIIKKYDFVNCYVLFSPFVLSLLKAKGKTYRDVMNALMQSKIYYPGKKEFAEVVRRILFE